MKKLFQYIIIVIGLSSLLLNSGCKKYLDEKPSKSFVIPNTLTDLQALMDNANANNRQYPALLEILADDYYVMYSDWASRGVDVRSNYIWNDQEAIMNTVYNNSYNTILYPNVVLETLPKIPVTADNGVQWDNIKGSALFFRSFAFFEIAQLYCKPYSSNTADADLGIPLRLSSDYTEVSVRSTVKETYDRILNDLKESVNLLPSTVPASGTFKTRPNKPAAFGLLARVYLEMENYGEAKKYADSCLQLYNTLIDYNTVNNASANPFPTFNAEVIYDGWSLGNGILNPANIAKVDSTLYRSYNNSDLRRSIFFTSNGTGTVGFKGSYAGVLFGQFFVGIATDEMYLTRAECAARSGDKDAAMSDLNLLLSKRYKTPYTPLTATDATDALSQILRERRKELLFRGLRWPDLRRLNKDPRFAMTLQRVLVNGTDIQTYTLPPNDLRYVLLFPQNVIDLSHVQQNPR